jgi:hypothetical protein
VERLYAAIVISYALFQAIVYHFIICHRLLQYALTCEADAVVSPMGWVVTASYNWYQAPLRWARSLLPWMLIWDSNSWRFELIFCERLSNGRLSPIIQMSHSMWYNTKFDSVHINPTAFIWTSITFLMLYIYFSFSSRSNYCRTPDWSSSLSTRTSLERNRDNMWYTTALKWTSITLYWSYTVIFTDTCLNWM